MKKAYLTFSLLAFLNSQQAQQTNEAKENFNLLFSGNIAAGSFDVESILNIHGTGYDTLQVQRSIGNNLVIQPALSLEYRRWLSFSAQLRSGPARWRNAAQVETTGKMSVFGFQLGINLVKTEMIRWRLFGEANWASLKFSSGLSVLPEGETEPIVLENLFHFRASSPGAAFGTDVICFFEDELIGLNLRLAWIPYEANLKVAERQNEFNGYGITDGYMSLRGTEISTGLVFRLRNI